MGRVISLENLDVALNSIKSIKDSPKKISQAINRTASWTRTQASRKIRDQVNLTATYLNQNLSVGRPANPDNLSTTITGRFRATSLARYAKGTPETTRKNGQVTVTVKPGHPKQMKSAFLMRLKGIDGATADGKGNIGLAVRVKPGETLRNKHKMMNGSKTKGLALLYGPSVDQLFRSVSKDMTDDIKNYLQQEYVRLLKL